MCRVKTANKRKNTARTFNVDCANINGDYRQYYISYESVKQDAYFFVWINIFGETIDMYLQQILNGVSFSTSGSGDPDITSLSCDTRTVKPGCLFFCLKGSSYDGHDFFRKVIGDGAAAIVTERRLNTAALQIIVEDSREVMAYAAKNFYGNAIDNMKLICVVGTNGKTSTTYLLDAVFNNAGFNTGVIGSNGVFINGQRYDSPLTTPDPIELHYWFRQMYLNKVHYVFMEVSAHAIALRKMKGVTADLTVFTNFSRDHLDYFKTMENYAETKKGFFVPRYTKTAAINADDKLGREIAAQTEVPVVTYGCDPSGADVYGTDFSSSDDGISYTLSLYGETARVSFPLQGKFNMYNTLAAAAAARVFGIKADDIIKGMNTVNCIAGRNETVYRSDGARIVVDFAHTPDGIENILSYLKNTCDGKLIVVFGCGGNRDKFKRPLMAEAVSRYADFAVLTNDNPRYEQPSAIAADAETSLTCLHKVILNRSQATEFALSVAAAGDTVAILGKGAEKYQEIKGKKYPYSDCEVVMKLLKNDGLNGG